jgi:hypothetical protein
LVSLARPSTTLRQAQSDRTGDTVFGLLSQRRRIETNIHTEYNSFNDRSTFFSTVCHPHLDPVLRGLGWRGGAGVLHRAAGLDALGALRAALPGADLRFPSAPPAGPRVYLRQAQWVGVYGLVLLWLRWGKFLTLWLILGLAGGLLAIEWLIRLRERSRWNPPTPESDDESA